MAMMASRQARRIRRQVVRCDRERGLQRVAGEIGQRLGDRAKAQVAGHVPARDRDQLPTVGDPEPRDRLRRHPMGPAPAGSSHRIRHVSAYRVRQPARTPAASSQRSATRQ